MVKRVEQLESSASERELLDTNGLRMKAFMNHIENAYRFDMNIFGSAAKNIRYVTDKEIERFYAPEP